MSKITLKLDESNDLNFQFRVQGTSSESGASAPQFRFLVSEKDNSNGIGFIFPVAAKESNGTITVTVPAMNEMVKEGIVYTGKVEVIVGSRILTPTIMEVEFTRTLAVEVVPMLAETINQPKPAVLNQVSPEEIMFELEETAPVKTEGAKKQVSLTKTQLQALIKERVAQKKAQLGNPFKGSLKDLMKSALED